MTYRDFIKILVSIYLSLILSMVYGGCNAAEPVQDTERGLPEELLGQWQVVEVHIDHFATRARQYNEGDRRLLGHTFSISPNLIVDDTEDDENGCAKATFSLKKISAISLFRDSFAKRLTGDTEVQPGDFGLNFSLGNIVEIASVSCAAQLWNNGIGAENGVQGSWILIHSSEILLIHWYDDVLLVLKKISASTTSGPSYSCQSAATKVETTVCSSAELSLLDRSVNAAYEKYLRDLNSSGDSSGKILLRASQRNWIKKRNACDTDEKCLSKVMRDRLQKILDHE